MPSRNSGYGIAGRPKQNRDALNWSTAKISSVMLLIAGGIVRRIPNGTRVRPADASL